MSKKIFITTKGHLEWSEELQQYLAVSDEGYEYNGPIAKAGGSPFLEQGSTRFYENGTESGANPLALENTDVNLEFDTQIQLRFLVEETAGVKTNNPSFTLEVSINGGVYNRADTVLSGIFVNDSTFLTLGDPTTERISTTGSTTWVAVAGVNDDSGTTSLTADPDNQYFNLLWTIQLDPAYVSVDDVVTFRVERDGAVLENYQQALPTVTAVSGTGTQTINDTPFISATSTTFIPAVDPGEITLSGMDFISSTAETYVPELLPTYTVDLLLIASLSQTYTVDISTIYDLGLDFRSTGFQVYDPTLVINKVIDDVDFVSPTSTTFLPSVTIDSPLQTINDTDFIVSGSTTFLPVVAKVTFVATLETFDQATSNTLACHGTGDWQIDFGDGLWRNKVANSSTGFYASDPSKIVKIRSYNLVTRLELMTDTFVDLDISLSDTLTSMEDMCLGVSKLTSFSVDDASNVTNFSSAWSGCSGLTSFPLINIGSATSLPTTWAGCSGLTEFPLLVVPPTVTTINNAWDACSGLLTFPLLDLSNVSQVSYAWRNCTSLVSLPALDTSNVTNFYSAWFNCSSLTTFPVLDYTKSTSLVLVWYACVSLVEPPSFVNPPLVTGSMLRTFKSCQSMVRAPTGLDWSSVTSLSETFYSCQNLEHVADDIGAINGTDFTWTFRDCTSLVCIGGIDTVGFTTTALMFDNTPALLHPNAAEQTLLLSGYDYDNALPCPEPDIELSFIPSGSSTFIPTLSVGSVTISDLGFIASGNSLFTPSFSGTLTISDIGFIASGSSTFIPELTIASDAAVTVARYLLNEDSSGQVPTTIFDDEGTTDLTINYGGDETHSRWTSDGAGNGWEAVAAPSTSTLIAKHDGLDGTTLAAGLDGKSKVSVLIRAGDLLGTSNIDRAVFIGTDNNNGSLALCVNAAGELVARFNAKQATIESRFPAPPTGVNTLAIVCDTSEASNPDRVKIYYNGSSTPETPLSTTGTFSGALSIGDTTIDMCLFNRGAANRSGHGILYYVEFLAGLLTATEIADSHTALSDDHDGDWRTYVAFQSISCPFIASGNTLNEPELVDKIFDDFSTDLRKWTETSFGSSWALDTAVDKLKPSAVTAGGLGEFLYTSYDAPTLTQWAKVTSSDGFNNGRYFGVVLRGAMGATLNCYHLQADDSHIYLATITDDVWSNRANDGGANGPWGASDTLGASVEGVGDDTVIKVWRNPVGVDPSEWGTPLWSYSGLTIANSIDTGNHLGVCHYGYTGWAFRFDDFEGGSFDLTQSISDLPTIVSGNTLFPVTLTGSITISDVPFIASSSTTFLPVVTTSGTSTQTINDAPFIASGNALYQHTITGTKTISDVDFISSTSNIFPISISSSIEISDIDFISSNNLLYVIDVGIKPYETGVINASPFYEGQSINWWEIYVPWGNGQGITEGASIGDIPLNLEYIGLLDFFTGLQGTLADTSRGTYTVQFTATNPYGTTESSEIVVVVNPVIRTPYIPSGNTVLPVSLDGSQVVDISFIASGNSTFTPNVNAGSVTADIGFIGSSNVLYQQALGFKPLLASTGITTPRFEGDLVINAQCFMTWSYATANGINVGDLPSDLVFGNFGYTITYLAGTLADGSAGTYSIQHSTTNQFGTTISPAFEFVVQKKLSSDFIGSASQTFAPSLEIISHIDLSLIPSESLTYDVTVTPGTYTLNNDFIDSTSVTYVPNLTALVIGQVDAEFIFPTSELFNVSLSVGEVILSPSYIASTSETFDVTIIAGEVSCTISYIPSQNIVYDVDVYSSFGTLIGFISSSSTTFDVSLTSYVVVNIDYIATANILFDISINQIVTFDIDFIASTIELFLPVVTDDIIEVDVIEFTLNINLNVDKILYVAKLPVFISYIDTESSNSLNINTKSEHQVEL